MSGEHICVGCNELHGNAHRRDCPRVTRERLLNAQPEEFFGGDAVARAANGQRLKVNDEDCSTALEYVKEYPAGEPEPTWDAEGALKAAQDQAYGALNTDPRETDTRLAFAQTAQAFALIAIAHALREPTNVLLAPDDDGYLDQIMKSLRELPDEVQRGIVRGLWEARPR